ncbi:amidohydrolase family protein [Arthrobacter sp. NPDC080031]|uniref:amidohydrolase family protein n=1 Tax=Arthrobacter sp. NPDC080031 TaxID=3155918 RepID=UPI00344D90D5
MQVGVVDCDTHPIVPLRELVDYVAEPYRSRHFLKDIEEFDQNSSLYTPPATTTRSDSIPPAGGAPGSDPDFLRRQVLVEAGVDYAFLIFLQPKTKFHNPQLDSAVFAAHNEWMADTWLGRHNWHGRYRGSIRVSTHDPIAAAREIEKWAGHPHIGQVYIVPEDPVPLGNPQFHPIYEAAERAGLPIAMHVTGRPGMYNLTPTGFAGYHMETFTQWPLYFMSNMASIVFEGVLDKYPGLKFVNVEGGFSWAAPFLWRLDKVWERMRGELTDCRRRPSEYVAESVRFTTQPLEEPKNHQHLAKAMDWLDASKVLMFSSDYPHYDFDSPTWVMRQLGRDRKEQVLAGNAIELYGLPSERPRDANDDEREKFLADPLSGTISLVRKTTAPQYFAEQED